MLETRTFCDPLAPKTLFRSPWVSERALAFYMNGDLSSELLRGRNLNDLLLSRADKPPPFGSFVPNPWGYAFFGRSSHRFG